MSGLHWDATGDGPPLILIQGLGYPAAMFHRVIPLLAEHFRVITFDNRGVAHNSHLDVEGMTIEQMADDAASVIEAAAGGTAASGTTAAGTGTASSGTTTVVGISLCGIVAQQLALAHPELVDGLVLASTHTCDAHVTYADPEVLQMLASRSELSEEAALRASLPYVYAPNTEADLIEEDVAVRAEYPVDPTVYNAQMMAAGGFAGTWERLPGIQLPTLVLHGSADMLVPPGNGETIASRIPGAELRLLEGGAHNIFSERAEEFARAIVDFHSRAR